MRSIMKERCQASVMLVDDERMTRLIYRDMLEHNGFTVTECKNGQEAIDMFAFCSPDVILLDVLMPGIDGFETCRIIRSLPGGDAVNIILVTGLDDDEFVEKAFAAGADDFVIKPVKWSIMQHRMQLLVARRDAEKQLSVVNRIVAEANKSTSLQETLDSILQMIQETMDYDGGGFYLLADGGRQALLTSSNVPDEFAALVKTLDITLEPQGRLFAFQEPVFMEDTQKANSRFLAQWGFAAMAMVPVISGKRLVGAFCTISRKRRQFSDFERETLIAIGKEVGSLIVREQVFDELLRSEEKFHSLVEQSVDGIVIIDSSGRIVEWNTGMEVILGIPREEMYNTFLWDLNMAFVGGLDSEQKREALKNSIIHVLQNGGGPWLGEYRELPLVSRDGRIKHTQFISFMYNAASGKMMATIARDITKTKELEAQLRYMGLHDTLTGLNNRAYFNEEMQRLGDGRLDPVCIIVCDLNFFKELNDTRGHQAGDRALVEVARLLRGCFRKNDVVARMGGDEFAIIMHETGEELARQALHRIAESIQEYNSRQPEWAISMAVGYAVRQQPDMSLEDAYKTADTRMYMDKKKSKISSRPVDLEGKSSEQPASD